MHTHGSHAYIQVHTHTRTHAHRHTGTDDSPHSWGLMLLSDFSSGLKMTSKLCLCLCLFASWCVFAHMCNCMCVCVSGGGVYASRGWWLWEVGPGYRFTSCCLHCPERGPLPFSSSGQGRLQQDTQGRPSRAGHLILDTDKLQVRSHTGGLKHKMTPFGQNWHKYCY